MATLSLRHLAYATASILGVAYGLVFFYAPIEADQGFVQKIFYLHVPLAICSLAGFVAGGAFGLAYLRSGARRLDEHSYVAIHVALVFGAVTLATGSIWARASWGHWWVWREPTLVSFLIVFLLYATYQPLRFAIEDHERQGRYAAVFAIVGAAFIPVNFVAVRLAQAYTHPRVLGATGGSMPGSMRLTFLCCLAAISLLYVTLCRLELAAKRVRFRHRALMRMGRDDLDDGIVPPGPRPVQPVIVPGGH